MIKMETAANWWPQGEFEDALLIGSLRSPIVTRGAFFFGRHCVHFMFQVPSLSGEVARRNQSRLFIWRTGNEMRQAVHASVPYDVHSVFRSVDLFKFWFGAAGCSGVCLEVRYYG